MNSFFQSDSVGGMSVSPHTPRMSPVVPPCAPVSRKRPNGQPVITASKKPRELNYNSPASNAATLMQYWPNAPGQYQLAHTIANMEMVTPISPVSPIQRSSNHFSPFPTPNVMMYSHASPFPHYAPNYMAFHPGSSIVDPGSFLPYLRPNEHSNNHTSVTHSDYPFGSPFRSHLPASPNVYGRQLTAYMGLQTPRHMNSPFSYKEKDRSELFSEDEDAAESHFVPPQYTLFTPMKKNQQQQMYCDEPGSNRRKAFNTPPQTPRTSYAGSQAPSGRPDYRRQQFPNTVSTTACVWSDNPEPGPSYCELVEYAMIDFGIEPREVWPTDSPPTATQNAKQDAYALPMSVSNATATLWSDECWPGSDGSSAEMAPTMPYSMRNNVSAAVANEKLQSVLGVNKKIPKLEHCWSTTNFESNKENIPPSFMLNAKQEVVCATSGTPLSSNRSHLRTSTSTLNLSGSCLNIGRRSPLEPSRKTGSSEVGASSRKPDDSTHTVSMVQRNSTTSSSKWAPMLRLSK